MVGLLSFVTLVKNAFYRYWYQCLITLESEVAIRGYGSVNQFSLNSSCSDLATVGFANRINSSIQVNNGPT